MARPATPARSLTDAKTWTQSGGTVFVAGGERLSLSGAGDTFAGTLTGEGAIVFTGGTDTLSAVTLSAASTNINGAIVTLLGAVDNTGALIVASS
jgi:formylmethanofuran dehydrogenase subunit C